MAHGAEAGFLGDGGDFDVVRGFEQEEGVLQAQAVDVFGG